MADPAIQALRAGPETLSSAAIPFRFEVTWRSLTRPLEPTRAPSSAIEKAISIPARTIHARRVSPPETEVREWEMVLPRTKRPVVAPPAVAPNFTVAAERSSGQRIALVGALVIAATITAVYWNGRGASQKSESAATTDMGSAGWIAEW